MRRKQRRARGAPGDRAKSSSEGVVSAFRVCTDGGGGGETKGRPRNRLRINV